MHSNFKSGELVFYKSQYPRKDIVAIIIRKVFQDNSGVEYFKCLIDNRIDTCCEVWLKKP